MNAKDKSALSIGQPLIYRGDPVTLLEVGNRQKYFVETETGERLLVSYRCLHFPELEIALTSADIAESVIPVDTLSDSAEYPYCELDLQENERTELADVEVLLPTQAMYLESLKTRIHPHVGLFRELAEISYVAIATGFFFLLSTL